MSRSERTTSARDPFGNSAKAPGAGLENFNAALRNDYEVMLGITVLVGVVTVLGNLLADIGYAILDPRIRY